MTTDIAKKIKRDGDIRLRRDLEKLDEPIKSDQWKNLYFLKDGRSDFGNEVFPSQQDAAKAAGPSHPDRPFLEWKGGRVPMEMYSHAIQIPVLP